MAKRNKLKLCNWLLLLVTIIALASSVHLEITESQDSFWIYGHIIIGCLFLGNMIWHLYLHYGWKTCLEKICKRKSGGIRWLAVVTLLISISAIVAFFHWELTHVHSPIGGIHGKIGFIFLIFVAYHIIKRIKFYSH